MQISDIVKSKRCVPLLCEVNEFTSKLLKQYNDDLENDNYDFQNKDIFDLVWGTIELSAGEICILDSPLLQRLRRIRQLGMASTVCCNADHSRFSHTLGVLEVSGRMAAVVLKKVKQDKSPFDFQEIVRFAALFHDVGHMFYSHVSEIFFAYDPAFLDHRRISNAKAYFCTNTSSTSDLHEMLSVMAVNSDEVRRLFKILSQQNVLSSNISKQENLDLFLEYISSLIIGVPVDKAVLPYSMIINSAIDADKLDYLCRDSACTRVPIAIDVARIIKKLDIVTCKETPRSNIWNDVTSPSVPCYIMAIKNSAKTVFWQLSSARAMMFESVYYHHKILTAETMFREKEVKKLLSDLNCRNLYKRVAAFSRETLLSDSIAPVKTFIDTVIKIPGSEKAVRFKTRLAAEYQRICALLQRPRAKAPDFMFIEMQYQEMDPIPIEMGKGLFVWSSHLMKQETMESGRKSKQEQYFLITNSVDRDVIFLALEKTLLSYDIRGLSEEAAICAKFSMTKLNKIRNRLLDLHYYDESLFLLPDEMFRQMFSLPLFETAVLKYHSFTGVDSCQVTDKALFSFLRQFLVLKRTKEEMSVIVNGVLKILNQALFIDREFFAENVQMILRELKQTGRGKDYITLLGSQFDSAKHLSYYFNDVSLRRDFIFADNIGNVLPGITPPDQLAFFDEGAYSGKQVVSIFQEYCGIAPEERTTPEHHVDPLGPEELTKLKEADIVLSYLCFNPKSESFIKQELMKLGFANVKILYKCDLSKKIFDDNSFGLESENIRLIRDAFEEIGEKILLARCYNADKKMFKDGWSERAGSRVHTGVQ